MDNMAQSLRATVEIASWVTGPAGEVTQSALILEIGQHLGTLSDTPAGWRQLRWRWRFRAPRSSGHYSMMAKFLLFQQVAAGEEREAPG